MASVNITASFADGTRLDEMGKILQERMKWMRESARDSVAACAITVLKSIRTITKVAKPNGMKVSVAVATALYPAYREEGSKKFLCVRYKGSNQRYVGKERIIPAAQPTHIHTWQVYRFTNTLDPNLTTYLILAPNSSTAKQKAKSIMWGRAKRFAGLARRAIGVLMTKTATTKVHDAVSMRVDAKAREVTAVEETVAKSADGNGGKYSLTACDDLRYALNAIKGGKAAIDLQMKKAMNKMVSVINKKIPDGSTFFGKKKLPTPFPEIVRKRK